MSLSPTTVLADESEAIAAANEGANRATGSLSSAVTDLELHGLEVEDADGDRVRLDDGSGTMIPVDVAFDIMKNRRRRRVLEYVLDNGGNATLSELAEHVAAIENDKPESLLSSQERKRVYIGLYQCHLPRMDDAGVVEFDRYRGTVEAGAEARVLQPYVEGEKLAGDDRTAPTAWSRELVFACAALYAVASLAPGLPVWVAHAAVVTLLVGVGMLAMRSLRRAHRQASPASVRSFLS